MGDCHSFTPVKNSARSPQSPRANRSSRTVRVRFAVAVAALCGSALTAGNLLAPRCVAQDSKTNPQSPQAQPQTPPSQSTPPQAAKTEVVRQAQELVQKLGDDEYRVREEATASLLRLGLDALPAIEDGRREFDREIRLRCERILYLVKQQDFERKIEAFLNGKGEAPAAEFPSWEPFRGEYGDSPENRRLFVEMMRAEPQLMTTIGRTPRPSLETLNERCRELQQAMQTQGAEVPHGRVIALLYVAIVGNAETNISVAQQVCNFCQQNSFRTAITSGKNRDVLRKMLGKWCLRGEDWVAYQMLMLALNYELPEGLAVSEKMLKNPNSAAHLRGYAVVGYAKLAKPDQWGLLESLLTDERSIGTWQMNNVNINAQVRDVALAALVKLHLLDAKTYGFERLQENPPYLFNPITAGFESAELRTKAMKKWQEFAETRKKAAGREEKKREGS